MSRMHNLYHSYSRGLCPFCRRLVDGARILRDGKVFLRKQCPEHGTSEALISGDMSWFLRSQTAIKPGSVPLRHATEVSKGCPDDCGLCPDHEQHSCLPIIEITNHCNLSCPVCLVDNRNNYMMPRESFERILDGLVASEGTLETINVSGGEPTLHPEFLDFMALACKRSEIARVSVSTNGLRCATDRAFCDELARLGVYVSLQLDAMSGAVLNQLRGPGDLLYAKERALENLERAKVRTTLVCTVARGVNDGHLGEVLELLYSRDFILSLTLQPAAYMGDFSPHDPLDVVTIPDVARALEEQSAGKLKKSDFLPLPCSHPSCFALTYLLQTDSGYVPFSRFLPLDKLLDLVANRGTLCPDDTLEGALREAIDDMWTSAGQVPDGQKILKSLKRAIFLLYPEDRAIALEERLRIGERLVKTVFIHGFMDPYTFEVERIKKCCTHYALPDGRLMPGCAYNMLYRSCDPRFDLPVGP